MSPGITCCSSRLSSALSRGFSDAGASGKKSRISAALSWSRFRFARWAAHGSRLAVLRFFGAPFFVLAVVFRFFVVVFAPAFLDFFAIAVRPCRQPLHTTRLLRVNSDLALS